MKTKRPGKPGAMFYSLNEIVNQTLHYRSAIISLVQNSLVLQYYYHSTISTIQMNDAISYLKHY